MLPKTSQSQDDILLSSGSGYAHRRKEALALVQKLRASGAQADLDLPRIAVIGNQSAGKSSLVEAISGITVPRDAGTCTRCPMECRMSSSTGSWCCQISIRWEYDKDGKREDKVQEVPFGGLITDKTQVELMLRRAQAAVLNPNIPSSKFLTMSIDNLISSSRIQARGLLLFSRNAVCIDLAGPELTDLSFVDLPGIIQNAEPEVVRLVEELVTSHINGNCLILVTLPMSDDIDNQKAARLARDADPSGVRTIGVLTKPDTLPAGSTKLRELWLELLEGRSVDNRLAHGYFCTRQPDDAERAAGITSVDARATEAAFFAQMSPWSTSPHQHRFGTLNLVKTLSNLLIEIINKALPKLQDEVTQQLIKCATELDRLPPSVTTEPSTYVLTLVTGFCNNVKAYVQGGSSTAELVQNNRRSYASFKRGIRSTAPPFIPYPSEKEAARNFLSYLKIDDEEEDNEKANVSATGRAATPTHTKYIYLHDMKAYIRTSVTRELPNNVPYPAKIALILGFQKTWNQQCQNLFESVSKDFNNTLSLLMQKSFHRYDNLLARVHSAVQDLLKARKDATVTYLQSLLQLETTPFTQNSHYLAAKTADYLAQYKNARAGTKAHIGNAPVSKVSSVFGVSNELSRNTVRPSPSAFSSTFSFSSSNNKASDSSSSANPANSTRFTFPPVTVQNAAIASPAAPSPPQTTAGGQDVEREKYQTDALAALTKLGFVGVTVEDLAKLNPPDEFEEELQVMAEVRAYFHVAYKRVIDYVPLSIDHLFLYGVTEGLQMLLIEKLGLGSAKSAERCAAYLAEDPSVVAIRKELLNKKERLEGVQLELDNFGL